MLSRIREEAGQGHTEYASLLVAIGLASLLTLLYLGGWLSDLYQWIINHLPV